MHSLNENIIMYWYIVPDRKPNFCHSRNSLLSFLRRQESSKLLCSLDSCLRRNDTNGLEFENKGLFGQTLYLIYKIFFVYSNSHAHPESSLNMLFRAVNLCMQENFLNTKEFGNASQNPLFTG